MATGTRTGRPHRQGRQQRIAESGWPHGQSDRGRGRGRELAPAPAGLRRRTDRYHQGGGWHPLLQYLLSYYDSGHSAERDLDVGPARSVWAVRQRGAGEQHHRSGRGKELALAPAGEAAAH